MLVRRPALSNQPLPSHIIIRPSSYHFTSPPQHSRSRNNWTPRSEELNRPCPGYATYFCYANVVMRLIVVLRFMGGPWHCQCSMCGDATYHVGDATYHVGDATYHGYATSDRAQSQHAHQQDLPSRHGPPTNEIGSRTRLFSLNMV